MKKIILAIVAIAATVTAAQAQKAEVSVSYGGYTQMDATDCHDGWNHVGNAWGALNVGANFNVLPKLWLGPSYTFSSTSQTGNHTGKVAYHAIMLNGRYEYYRNSIVKVYGHLGLGAVISHMQPGHGFDSYNKGYFAYQISPVGADVSLTKRLTMFGELGFGAQGLIQAGVRIKI